MVFVWPVWPQTFEETFAFISSLYSLLTKKEQESKMLSLVVSINTHEKVLENGLPSFWNDMTSHIFAQVLTLPQVEGYCFSNAIFIEPENVFTGYTKTTSMHAYALSFVEHTIPIIVFINSRHSTHSIANIRELKDECDSDEELLNLGIICMTNALDHEKIKHNSAIIRASNIIVSLHGSDLIYGKFMRKGSGIIEIDPQDMSQGWIDAYYPKIYNDIDLHQHIFYKNVKTPFTNHPAKDGLPSHSSVFLSYDLFSKEVQEMATKIRAFLHQSRRNDSFFTK
jgi:hypothetical protein